MSDRHTGHADAVILRTPGNRTMMNQTPDMWWLLVWRESDSHKNLSVIRPGGGNGGESGM